MKNYWELYENMNEVVYVTDIDTFDVVYVNRYGRELFNIKNMDDIKGIPCYKVLQGCSQQCSICTNSKLKDGEFLEWKHHNALVDKTYFVKDTLITDGNKRYRMEIAIDVSEMDKQKQVIKEFSSNEALVNNALRLSLSESTPEKSIKTLLNHLGQSLRSDRVYIFEETDTDTVNNTYEWCAEGVEPQIDNLQNVPFSVVSLWYEKFYKNENIVIKSLASIKDTDPEAYAVLLPQQIDSLVVSPLIIDDKIVGFYGVDNPPKDFLNHISVMFMVLGYFISSILKRRNLVNKLERLSYYDQLTGALNRHGMNEFVANVDHDASIAILYCDVTGLKEINDTLGHLEGDKHLLKCYNCLEKVFGANNVFRMGGDEFLVMSSNIAKDFADEKVKELKNILEKNNVHMALGYVWEPKCNGRIASLLKQADEIMYDDKNEYYLTHPKYKRK